MNHHARSAAAVLGDQTLLLKSPSRLSHLGHAAGQVIVRPKLRTSRKRSERRPLRNASENSSLANWSLSSRRKRKKRNTQAPRKKRRSLPFDISRKAPETSRGLSYLRIGTPWTDHLSMQLEPSSPTHSDQSCFDCKTTVGDESMHRPRFQSSPGDYIQSL